MKSRINKLEYRLDINYNNKYYYKNDRRHRDKDLPALVWKDGSRIWYKNDRRHRDKDLPAIILDSGYNGWYENGEYIRSNLDEIKNK